MGGSASIEIVLKLSGRNKYIVTGTSGEGASLTKAIAAGLK
jgi:hypothetical protein